MNVANELIAFAEEESNEFVPHIIGLDDTTISSGDEREKIVLLYVNEDNFNDDSITNILQYALDEKVNIIMVHDQVSIRGACKFGDTIE